MDMNMQKSVPTSKSPARQERFRAEPLNDKGQKFEPYWAVVFNNDSRSLARQHLADQKR
jgi:hypothetical protein